MTQHERSGLRDEELRLRHAELRLSMPADDMQLSARHRQWGASVPCVNVDFLAVEYSMGRAAALVDYKRFTNRRLLAADMGRYRGCAERCGA